MGHNADERDKQSILLMYGTGTSELEPGKVWNEMIGNKGFKLFDM